MSGEPPGAESTRLDTSNNSNEVNSNYKIQILKKNLLSYWLIYYLVNLFIRHTFMTSMLNPINPGRIIPVLIDCLIHWLIRCPLSCMIFMIWTRLLKTRLCPRPPPLHVTRLSAPPPLYPSSLCPPGRRIL